MAPSGIKPVPMMDLTTLKERLSVFQQEHLLHFWEHLDQDERAALYNELNELNLAEVTGYFEQTVTVQPESARKLDGLMEPLDSDQCGSVLKMTEKDREEYTKASYQTISEGRLAILLLAGGQGTRLGVNYPKGMYDVGLPSKKTLFQLQAERILKLQMLAEQATGKKGSICWYIMTSASTIQQTKIFFETHNYFGLSPSNVVFFKQGTLPCFTFEGKMILSSPSSLARAPDGNGGLYQALSKYGILNDMRHRGVKCIQLYCVDNILVRVGDPLFIGYCLTKGAECANKVVSKSSPVEPVGITCKVDGKYQVVEYSEITPEAAGQQRDDGSLAYSAANICIHYFTLDFLQEIVERYEKQLVHHVAKKKIPFMDTSSGKLVVPTRPNGIKLEKFVFDVFRFAKNFVVWECVREEEFAPLKNAEGAKDSTPSYCRNALLALHQKCVLEAGGTLVDKDGNKLPQMASPAAPKIMSNNDNNNNQEKSKCDTVTCELSPLVTYAGEGLESLVGGKTFTVPTCSIGLDSFAKSKMQ